MTREQAISTAEAYRAGWKEADGDIEANVPFRACTEIRRLAAKHYPDRVEHDAFVVGYLQNSKTLMPAATFEMVLEPDRTRVFDKIADLPDGTRVTFKGPVRSLSQNAHMWALLDDLHEQVIWYGERLSSEDWKNVLTASLRKSRVVPTIDGDGLVPLGLYTHEMSYEEMNALIALIYAFGAEQRVKWKASKWFEERVKQMRTR